MSFPIELSVSDGLARLTLTNPERGNPIDQAFADRLSDLSSQLSERPDVRCVLLDAVGKSFSVGGDLRPLAADFDAAPTSAKRLTAAFHSGIARLQRIDAPIVAAVQGACAGGMASFVAGSDIVIAASNAKFVPAFTAIGFSGDGGGSVFYTRRMGLGRARRFLLMNETLDAAGALGAGLADEVVPADELASHAEAVARRLAQGPTRAYGEIRRLLLSAGQTPLETQLELESQAVARTLNTADAREGVSAFLEKRRPAFRGS